MNTTALIRPAWTPATIALMVIGFMVFWPLGFAMLAYIVWGDRLDGSDTAGARQGHEPARRLRPCDQSRTICGVARAAPFLFCSPCSFTPLAVFLESRIVQPCPSASFAT